jgi:hypothetical protein
MEHPRRGGIQAKIGGHQISNQPYLYLLLLMCVCLSLSNHKRSDVANIHNEEIQQVTEIVAVKFQEVDLAD